MHPIASASSPIRMENQRQALCVIDCLQGIISHARPQDHRNLRQVARLWKETADQPAVWQNRFAPCTVDRENMVVWRAYAANGPLTYTNPYIDPAKDKTVLLVNRRGWQLRHGYLGRQSEEIFSKNAEMFRKVNGIIGVNWLGVRALDNNDKQVIGSYLLARAYLLQRGSDRPVYHDGTKALMIVIGLTGLSSALTVFVGLSKELKSVPLPLRLLYATYAGLLPVVAVPLLCFLLGKAFTNDGWTICRNFYVGHLDARYLDASARKLSRQKFEVGPY